MAEPEPATRVLLIDDDEDDYLLTRDLLAEITQGNYELAWKSDYDEALNAICRDGYDVALLDYSLGIRTGLDLLRDARRKECDLPIIFLTGQSSPEIDKQAMASGAVDFLEKSRLDATILDRAMRYAVRQKRYEMELERRVRERTQELDRANAALREADKRKDEFLATLAHELRNPLVPIRNSLEIMRLSGDSVAAVAAARGLLERQVGQLVRLIDDLLDVSRMTRNKLALTMESLTVREVIDAAVEQSRPLLDKAGQSLTVHAPAAPIKLTGDRVRLTQVLVNVLNNAAKYSDPGGRVTVTARRKGDRAVVSVRDTGLGIPPEMIGKVFEPFTQVDRSLNRTQGGLGIGLALVRQLVEMHHGDVAVQSAGAGQGSEFSISLPCM